MRENHIFHELQNIAKDRSLSFDIRLDKIITLLDDSGEDRETVMDACKIMIAMIKEEEALASHIAPLMQIYALLAETYADSGTFRLLEPLSIEVREILRDTRIAWEAVNEPLQMIIDSLKESVYSQETYRLLIVYLSLAKRNGKIDKNIKRYAILFLKLRILLDETYFWHDHLMTKEFQTDLASIFTSDELLKIIINPSIGHLRRDPVEYTPRWEEICYDVEDYLDRRFENAPRQHGFCHIYWEAKRQYLKDNYGIEWRSPAQMNPHVKFD